MITRPRVLALLLTMPALGLAACGGSDAQDIRTIVQKVDEDAVAICDHASKKLLSELGGTKQKCEAQAEANRAEAEAERIEGEITVKSTGDTATAEFSTTKGETRHVSLIKQDSIWKIEAIS